MSKLRELDVCFLLFSEPALVSETQKSKWQMQAGWQLMERIKEGAVLGPASCPSVAAKNA